MPGGHPAREVSTSLVFEGAWMTSTSNTPWFADGLTTCHECDAVHRLQPLSPGERAHCVRCGAVLYRDIRGRVDEALALATAALALFLIANFSPFIALKLEGRIEENLVVSGIFALWDAGQPELGVLVALTSVVFPALTLLGMLWLLVPLRLGFRAPGTTTVYRIIRLLGPWTLLGVFMLGVLIAMVKLADLATVIPGISMFAFAGLMVANAAAGARFDRSMFWPPQGPHVTRYRPGANARDLGLVACHTCALLVEETAPRAHGDCPRCGAALHGARIEDSVTRTWALVIAAVLLTIPANLYPVMTVIRFGQGEPSTIMGGVIKLIQGGMWGLAMIVFFASIVVPVMKLGLLIFLLTSVQRRSNWRPRDRTRLFRITEVVGAWSMVDIFLVGVLSALVHLQALATIEPGIGASYFGGVVVITMFAAHSFDPRLIWDEATPNP